MSIICGWVDNSSLPMQTITNIPGLNFAASDGFTGNHAVGTHIHMAAVAPPPPGLVFDGAEVGGFFGDESVRGMMEFDLSIIPAGTIISATLTFEFPDLSAFDPFGTAGSPFGQDKYFGNIDLHSYAGNGLVETTDYTIAATYMNTFNVPVIVPVGFTWNINVPIALITGTHLGFRFQLPVEDRNADAITFSNSVLSVITN